MGNVLLGDDGLGPYIIHLLESQYSFDENVELADLGTPALDLTHRIAGREAIILIDCIATAEYAPGTVLVYDKADLLSAIPAQRCDPHSPALSECLLTAEMLGATPEHVLLVGAVGERFEPGCPLSTVIRQSIDKVIGEVLGELWCFGCKAEKQRFDEEPIWWAEEFSLLANRRPV